MFYSAKDFRPRDSVGYLLKSAHGLLQDCYEPVLATRGFTFTQWVVLIWLRESRTLSPSDLCRHLRHDPGALTRVIDQLEARGLIERARSQQDRRVVELTLTPAGDAVLAELTPLIVAALNDALGDFSQDEFETLNRLLRKLIARVRDRVSAVSPGQDP